MDSTNPVARRRGLGRRELVAGLGAVAALSHPALGQTSAPGPLIGNALGEGQRFTPAAVVDLARAISRRPFVPPANDLPEAYAGLTHERYVAVRALPAGRIWHGENRGFVVEPLLRGFVFNTAVMLFTVEDGQVRRTTFDRSRYEFGSLALPPTAPEPGFSGARLVSTAGPGPEFEFAVIQGATFFRALARGQNFGTVARALTLKPAETRGEEFPIFRALWVERPTLGINELVVHGVLDSESVAGAVRMTFRPGDVTIVDVEMTLFPRVNLEHVGLAGMNAMFLFGPNVRRATDDVRPAVHETSGLSMHNGKGEWLWRPLNNPETLQISAFVDDNPKGLGLIQRERDFGAFLDDAQRFDRRPSLWIEPIGEWGEGAVQLIEIPSDAEINKNILAYWRPRAAIPGGSETMIAYRQFWTWSPPERPELATVAATRSGRGSGARRRRFVIEFVGESLGAAVPDLGAAVTTSPGSIRGVRLWPYPERKAVRVAFELDPGNENACEMRAVLQAGSTVLSETWLYRWTP